MTVLATATGLPNKTTDRLSGPPDGFLVGHLRLADAGGNIELAKQTVHYDLQMKLTHSADDRLPCI